MRPHLPARSAAFWRPLRWLAYGVGALLLVCAVLLAALLWFDWNRARPWLDARASAALGRPLHIAGPLQVHWVALPGPVHSWRDLVPWPRLEARDIHLAEPSGFGGPPDMAHIGVLSFTLNPFGLLAHRLQLPVLNLTDPDIRLQRLADGRVNWVFSPATSEHPWALDLERISINGGRLGFDDAVRGSSLQADIATLEGSAPYGLRWQVQGHWGKAPVHGQGKAGALLSLRQQDLPFPVAGDVRIGSTHIVLDGTVTRPSELAALDLHLAVAGASMARLYDILPIALPETPPFSTSGHLRASFGAARSEFHYENFKGKVGDSDIGGQISLRSGAPRPFLSGSVRSQLLRLSDLAPLIGADSNARKAEREAPAIQPANKLLPVEAFHTERWTSADADVQFEGERIVREAGPPITKLSTHILLKDGVLTLDPLRLGLAGGSFTAKIRLDSNQTAGMLADASLSARHLHIRQLLPQLEASIGEINGDAKLRGRGDSVASILAGADGQVQAAVGQGEISQLLLEEMGLNIGNVVLTKLVGDKPVVIHCALGDFTLEKGQLQVRKAAIDTDTALIDVTGKADLAREQLDFVIHPESKGIRVLSLRSPLYARGPFVKPDVGLDKSSVALRAGGALALGAIAPFAALLPLIATGPDQHSSCDGLMRPNNNSKR